MSNACASAVAAFGRTARLRALTLAALSLVLALSVGCFSPTTTPTPTAVPTRTPTATAVVTASATLTVGAEVTATATIPAPAAPISLTLQPVAFEQGLDVRPGAWSPDGLTLLAYVIVRSNGGEGPIGHLWTVDTGSAAPLWDSGDLEGPFTTLDMAAWLPDGTLALARSDGMLVRPEGGRVTETVGIAGQPREVLPAPTTSEAAGRVALLASGPSGAWLVGADGVARGIGQQLPGRIAAAAWRPDGGALVVVTDDGEYYRLEPATAALEKIAEAELAGADGPTAPRWLDDGRVLLTAPSIVTRGDETLFVHRLVDPASKRAVGLHELIGVAPNPQPLPNPSGWVSPGGRQVLFPELTVDRAADAGAALRARWLYDVSAGEANELPPIVRFVWAPDGDRFAFLDDEGLAVWLTGSGTRVHLADGARDVTDFAWSPDGRWVLFADADDTLWITAADGRVGPERVADGVVWAPAPSWAPAAEAARFAVALEDEDGVPRLTLVTVEGG